MSPIVAPFPSNKPDAIKAAYEAAGGTRTNLAYGYRSLTGCRSNSQPLSRTG
jgi:hypothetical protein